MREAYAKGAGGDAMTLPAFLRGFANGLTLLPLWRWLRRKI
jgi:hypothetical protein